MVFRVLFTFLSTVVSCCMVATFIKKDCAHYELCDWCMFKGDHLHVFVWSNVWVTGIFSDTINIMNVKLCMLVLHAEFYLFITLSVTLTLFQGHSSVKHF